MPPTMIVGGHGLTNENLRLQEYSPVFDAARFAAHEKFFVEDVRQWTESQFGVALPTERTADVVMKERTGSHDGALWRKEFPLMVAWAFGRE